MLDLNVSGAAPPVALRGDGAAPGQVRRGDADAPGASFGSLVDSLTTGGSDAPDQEEAPEAAAAAAPPAGRSGTGLSGKAAGGNGASTVPPSQPLIIPLATAQPVLVSGWAVSSRHGHSSQAGDEDEHDGNARSGKAGKSDPNADAAIAASVPDPSQQLPLVVRARVAADNDGRRVRRAATSVGPGQCEHRPRWLRPFKTRTRLRPPPRPLAARPRRPFGRNHRLSVLSRPKMRRQAPPTRIPPTCQQPRRSLAAPIEPRSRRARCRRTPRAPTRPPARRRHSRSPACRPTTAQRQRQRQRQRRRAPATPHDAPNSTPRSRPGTPSLGVTTADVAANVSATAAAPAGGASSGTSDQSGDGDAARSFRAAEAARAMARRWRGPDRAVAIGDDDQSGARLVRTAGVGARQSSRRAGSDRDRRVWNPAVQRRLRQCRRSRTGRGRVSGADRDGDARVGSESCGSSALGSFCAQGDRRRERCRVVD